MAKRQEAKMDDLRSRLLELKENRAQIKAISEYNDEHRAGLVVEVDEFDTENVGIVVDESDSAHSTAYAQRNKPSVFWDMEKLMSWLRKPTATQKALWMSVSSRVFDVKKFEAEIANGNITARQAARFRKTGADPTPFIKFEKAKKESL